MASIIVAIIRNIENKAKNIQYSAEHCSIPIMLSSPFPPFMKEASTTISHIVAIKTASFQGTILYS